MRVVIAEDLALLREGMTRLLERFGNDERNILAGVVNLVIA